MQLRFNPSKGLISFQENMFKVEQKVNSSEFSFVIDFFPFLCSFISHLLRLVRVQSRGGSAALRLVLNYILSTR